RDDCDVSCAWVQPERSAPPLVVPDTPTVPNRQRVFAFAAAQQLPAIYEFDYLVRDGGLLSYGPDVEESFGRVAALVARIFTGAKPADLPCEQPTRFRLVINLKTAQAMGLPVPPILLFQAVGILK